MQKRLNTKNLINMQQRMTNLLQGNCFPSKGTAKTLFSQKATKRVLLNSIQGIHNFQLAKREFQR